MQNSIDPQSSGKDPELWEIAKRRASFKSHLGVYIVVNIFLWAIWFLTADNDAGRGRYPWPVWSTLGWGIGLLFHEYCLRLENHNRRSLQYDNRIYFPVPQVRKERCLPF